MVSKYRAQQVVELVELSTPFEGGLYLHPTEEHIICRLPYDAPCPRARDSSAISCATSCLSKWSHWCRLKVSVTFSCITERTIPHSFCGLTHDAWHPMSTCADLRVDPNPTALLPIRGVRFSCISVVLFRAVASRLAQDAFGVPRSKEMLKQESRWYH